MIKKLLDGLEKVLSVILVILCCVMATSLFYQVLLRYVFSIANIWAEELSRFSMIWMCTLGCALSFRKGTQITITTLADLIPAGIRRIIDLVMYVLILGFLAVAFRQGLVLVESQLDVYTSGLVVSQGLMYTCIPISCVLMAIYILEFMYNKIKEIKPGKAKEETV